MSYLICQTGKNPSIWQHALWKAPCGRKNDPTPMEGNLAICASPSNPHTSLLGTNPKTHCRNMWRHGWCMRHNKRSTACHWESWNTPVLGHKPWHNSRQNNGLPEGLVSKSWSLWLSHLLWQRDTVDMVKIFRWGGHPALSKSIQCFKMSLPGQDRGRNHSQGRRHETEARGLGDSRTLSQEML